MTPEKRKTILGATCILSACLLGSCLIRSCNRSPAPDPNGKLVDLASRSVEVADEARADERSMILALDRYWFLGIVLAAGVPLLIALLVLRECGRKEPDVEEVLGEVTKAMLTERKQGQAETMKLLEAKREELRPPG